MCTQLVSCRNGCASIARRRCSSRWRTAPEIDAEKGQKTTHTLISKEQLANVDDKQLRDMRRSLTIQVAYEEHTFEAGGENVDMG